MLGRYCGSGRRDEILEQPGPSQHVSTNKDERAELYFAAEQDSQFPLTSFDFTASNSEVLPRGNH